MKRHQKYKQSAMYAAISKCDLEGTSYSDYCRRMNIPYASFKYWVTKYQLEKKDQSKNNQAVFVPVKISSGETLNKEEITSIQIHYPNGISLNCRATINLDYLKVLLKL